MYQTETEFLPDDEINRLAELIQAGKYSPDYQKRLLGYKAYCRLITHNIPIALAMAKRYKYKELGQVDELDDFFQVAMLALCKAALNYKPGEVYFTIFARRYIDNDLRTERANFGFPMRLHKDYYKEAQKLYEKRNGIIPDDDDGYLKTQQSKDKLSMVCRPPVYLDAINSRNEYEGERIEDPDSLLFQDEENEEEKKQLEILQNALDQLDDREKKSIRLRYGYDGCELSFPEIGKKINLGRAQARRIVLLAEDKIRKNCGIKDWEKNPKSKLHGR